MTAPEIVCVEIAARAKRPGSVRHWSREGELLEGTCRDCGEVKPAEDLTADRKSPGGRALRCLACFRAASNAYAATPTGAANEKARNRRAVNSGRKAEQNRRYRERPAESVRRNRAKYAARTPEELAEIQAAK